MSHGWHYWKNCDDPPATTDPYPQVSVQYPSIKTEYNHRRTNEPGACPGVTRVTHTTIERCNQLCTRLEPAPFSISLTICNWFPKCLSRVCIVMIRCLKAVRHVRPRTESLRDAPCGGTCLCCLLARWNNGTVKENEPSRTDDMIFRRGDRVHFRWPVLVRTHHAPHCAHSEEFFFVNTRHFSCNVVKLLNVYVDDNFPNCWRRKFKTWKTNLD